MGRRCQARRVLVMGLLLVTALTGCQGHGALVEDLTPQEAEAETSRLVTDAVDAITAEVDPSAIRVVDEIKNESTSCRGADVDPDHTVQQWVLQRNIRLVDGAQQLDVVNTVVEPYPDAGWVASIDEEETTGGGRFVQLLREAIAPGETYGLSFSAEANESTNPPVIFVRASSPCFLDPTR